LKPEWNANNGTAQAR